MDLAVTPAIRGDMPGMDGNTPVTDFVISGRIIAGGNALAGCLDVAIITIGGICGGDFELPGMV